MARKQNQKALYEAIRQGQMKIAEGLKTGQMRSDRRRLTSPGTAPRPYSGAEAATSAESDYEYNASPVSSKAALIGAAIVAQVVILALGIWFGAMFFKNRGETAQAAEPQAAVSKETERTPGRYPAPIMSVPDREASPVSYQVQETAKSPAPTAVEPVNIVAAVAEKPVVSTGGNVIVIQGIQEGRKAELATVKDFFARKGVETEVIIRNGYGLLVTRAGFEVNPESRGTPGFELMQRIRELGIAYPQETGDTKFGLKPFQDSYGLLK